MKKGLEFIHDLIKSNSKIGITPLLIREIHAISFQWIFPDWAGSFRIIQVTYSGKATLQYFQIPGLIAGLCEDLSSQLKNLPKTSKANFIDEVVRLLFWFQYRFVFIHPFQDYNGLVGRMLTVLLLLKLGLPAVEIKVETQQDREKYLDAMQSGDEGDLTPLEKLIGETLTVQLLV